MILNNLTFQKISRCWPGGHNGSQIQQLLECVQKLTIPAVLSVHASIVLVCDEEDLFTLLNILTDVSICAHMVILLVCSETCVFILRLSSLLPLYERCLKLNKTPAISIVRPKMLQS